MSTSKNIGNRDAIKRKVREAFTKKVIGLDTFERDLKTVYDNYSAIDGWRDAETMAGQVSSAKSMLDRAKAYKNYYVGKDAEYDSTDIDAVIESLTGINDWLTNQSSAFGAYSDADSYNAQAKKYADDYALFGNMSSDEISDYIDRWNADNEARNAGIDKEIARLKGFIGEYRTFLGDGTHTSDAFREEFGFGSQDYYPDGEVGDRKGFNDKIAEVEEELERRIAELESGKMTENSAALYYYYNKLYEELGAEGYTSDKKGDFDNRGRDGKLISSFDYALMAGEEAVDNMESAQRLATGAYTDYGSTGYKEITDEEKSLYLYLRDNVGEEAARGYFNYLYNANNDYNMALAARVGKSRSESKSDFEKIIGSVGTGLESWALGMARGVNSLFSDKPIPTQPFEYESSYTRESFDDSFWKGALYDVGVSVGNMAPSILATALTGNLLGAAGVTSKAALNVANIATSAATFGTSIYGNAYNEALLAGHGKEQAALYGIFTASAEVALQHVLGGIPGIGQHLTGDFIAQLANRTSNVLLKLTARLAGDSVGEFTEEYLQKILGQVFKNTVLGENGEIKLVSEEALYEGFLGALTSAGLNIPTSAFEYTGYKGTGKSYSGDIETLIKAGLEASPDTEAYKFAEILQGKVGEGKKLTNAQKGYLAQSIFEAVREDKNGNTQSIIQKTDTEGNVTDDKSTVIPELMAAARGNDVGENRQSEVIPELWEAARGAETAQESAEVLETDKSVAEVQTANEGVSVASQDDTEVDDDEYVDDKKKLTHAVKALGTGTQIAEAYNNENDGKGHREKQNVGVYVNDYKVVRAVAANGHSADAIKTMDIGGSLTSAQFDAAVREGHASVAKDGKLVAAEKNISDGAQRRQGKVYFNGMQGARRGKNSLYLPTSGINEKWRRNYSLSEDQKAALEFIEGVLAPMGVDVVLYSSKNNKSLPNGMYDGNRIYIDIEAGMTERARQTYVMYAIAHELTHMAERLSPETWRKYADAVLDILAQEDGKSVAELIRERQNEHEQAELERLKRVYYNAISKRTAELKAAGKSESEIERAINEYLKPKIKELDEAGAIKEIVADASQLILTRNSNFAEKLKAKDAGLCEKIIALAKKAIEKIREVLSGLATPNDGVSAAVEKHLDELTEYFDEMLADTLYKAGYTNETELSEVGEKVQFSYGGSKAKNADKMKLENAQRMLAGGIDSEIVRKETGWFKGYDGKWRFEIDDSDAYLVENPKFENRNDGEGGYFKVAKLGDVFTHDALYKAYPELKDYTVVIQDTETGTEGMTFLERKQIVLSKTLFERITKEYNDYIWGGKQKEIAEIEATPEYLEMDRYYDDDVIEEMDGEQWLKETELARDKFFSSDLGKRYYQLKWGDVDIRKFEPGWNDRAKMVLIHEIQHSIQHIEGFARGASPDYWAGKIQSGYDSKGKTPGELYGVTAGEVEAQDAGNRVDMLSEQRKNTRPDIDRSDVVFAKKATESYEIKRDNNGREYWQIDSGKDIFKGLTTPEEYRDAAYAYLISNRNNKVVVKDDFGREIIFIRLSAEEFTRSEESKDLFDKNSELFKKKMRLIPSLDDILLHSGINWPSPDHKNHKLFKEKGFENYRGKVGIDNVIFNTIVRVGKAKFGNVFYDINLEVDSYLPHTNSASDINKSTSYSNSISHFAEKSTPEPENLSENISDESGGDTSTQTQNRRTVGETDREVLSKALFDEGVASEADFKLLKEYRADLAAYREMEAEIRTLTAEINRLKNSNEVEQHKDNKLEAAYARRKELRDTLTKIDSKLLNIEAMSPMRRLITLERNKTQAAKQKLAHTRESYDKSLKKRQQDWRDKQLELERKRQKRNMRATYLARAERALSRIYRRLANPTKNDHIPSELLPFVKKLFDTIDVSHHFAEIEKLEEKLAVQTARINELMAQGADAATVAAQEAYAADLVERIKKLEGTAHNMTWRERMETLTKMVSKVEEVQNSSGIYADFAPGLAEKIQYSLDIFTDRPSVTRLFDAEPEQLRTYAEALESISHSIIEAGKMYANKRASSIAVLGDQAIDQFSYAKKEEAKSKLLEKPRALYGIDSLTPAYFGRKLGAATESVISELYDGFYATIANVRIIDEFSDKLRKKYKVGKFTGKNEKLHDIMLEGGGHVRLTTSQLMTVYALHDRPQAQKHLYGKGIKVFRGDINEAVRKTASLKDRAIDEGKRLFGKGKSDLNKELEKLLGGLGVHEVSPKDIDAMIGELTAEQIECVKEMKKFLKDVIAPMGNKTSQTLYLYDMFTEDNYFPIESDKTFIRLNEKDSKDGDISARSVFSILNKGFTKPVQENAGNPIIIRDIFDVFMEHCFDMANYGGLGVAVSDTIKWLNYKNENGSLRGEMELAYGKTAEKYIRNLLMSIEGELKGTDGAKLINKMIRNAKIAAVAANLRVVLLQPTAYIRAGMVLRGKNLAAALRHKPMIREAQEHSELMYYKMLGFYDMNTSSSLLEKLKDDQSTADKVREKSTALAGKMDEITWGCIWRACRYEVDDEIREKSLDIRKDSEEYFAKVRDKFHEVINFTQVIDTPMHKNKLMSDPDTGMKQLTAFMAEPMLTYNMLMSAVEDCTKKKSGAAKKLRRAFIVYSLSIAFQAALGGLADAARDDDDEERWFEKYGEAILRNMFGVDLDSPELEEVLAGDWNPFNNMPIIKEVFSLLEGYEPTRMDLQGMEKVVQAINKFQKLVTDTGDFSYKDFYSICQAVSLVLGIPISNIVRIVKSAHNTYLAWFGLNKK